MLHTHRIVTHRIAVLVVLGAALLLAVASGSALATNADLNGCYTLEDSIMLDSYWFDGDQQVEHSMWTPVSGSYYSGGSYQVTAGTLNIEYSDGETETFSLAVYGDGIELDGNWFNFSGASCE